MGDWVKMEFEFDDPLEEGITYGDIKWVSISGNMRREGHFAALGYYMAGDPRVVVASTMDNGETWQQGMVTNRADRVDFIPSSTPDK